MRDFLKIFDVKKKVTAIIIGAAVVSFPTVASVMMYNYVADSYALSFLLATLAALLMTNKKPKYILAAILIALSVGIYQAYITVTIMILLCYLITYVLNNADIKDFFLKSVKFLLTGIGGMLLYYLVLTVILKITCIELLEYQGFDNAASLAGLDFLGSLYTTCIRFFCF